MIQLLLNKTTPHFQLSPMSKVDQSYLRIHEVPPLQKAKSQVIFTCTTTICPDNLKITIIFLPITLSMCFECSLEATG